MTPNLCKFNLISLKWYKPNFKVAVYIYININEFEKSRKISKNLFNRKIFKYNPNPRKQMKSKMLTFKRIFRVSKSTQHKCMIWILDYWNKIV